MTGIASSTRALPSSPFRAATAARRRSGGPATRRPNSAVPSRSTTRLRVAIVTESPVQAGNGVARSVREVVYHLQHRGHDTLVIAPGSTTATGLPTAVHTMPSVPLPFCREFPVGLPTSGLGQAIERFRPDIVHLASPIVLGARGAAIARDLNVPAIAVYQTDVAGFATQYGLGRASQPVWRWLRHVHNGTARTLAPSRAAAAALRSHGIHEVHRWGRGVDTDTFSPDHRTRPPTEQVRRVRVGYIGRLSAEKRVDRLRVLTDLAGIELIIVGDGSDRQSVQRTLPHARFTGQLSGSALSAAYADLDVFVHTGIHETFCQAAQEALASGVSVVAPAAGGLLDLVRHGRNGLFFDAADERTLRQAVGRLAADPHLRARQSRAARTDVADRTWSAIVDELLDHYLEVLGRVPTVRLAA